MQKLNVFSLKVWILDGSWVGVPCSCTWRACDVRAMLDDRASSWCREWGEGWWARVQPRAWPSPRSESRHSTTGPHLTDKQRLSSQSYGSMFWPSTAIGQEVQYLKSLDWGWQPWDFYLQRFPITLTPNGTSAELNLQTVGVPQHNQHDRSHCATLSYVVHRVCVGVQLLADMTDSHSYTQSYGRSSTAPNSGSSLQHGH